jgi:hypothetical protein
VLLVVSLVVGTVMLLAVLTEPPLLPAICQEQEVDLGSPRLVG